MYRVWMKVHQLGQEHDSKVGREVHSISFFTDIFFCTVIKYVCENLSEKSGERMV
jgi:hypothetical protein